MQSERPHCGGPEHAFVRVDGGLDERDRACTRSHAVRDAAALFGVWLGAQLVFSEPSEVAIVHYTHSTSRFMCIPYIVRALGYKSFRASLALNVNVDRRTCHGGQIRCSCLLARAHDMWALKLASELSRGSRTAPVFLSFPQAPSFTEELSMVSIRDLQSSVHLKLTVSPGQGGADMFFTVYDLLALVRDQTSLAAHALAARGTELHTVNASSPSAVTKAFGGADVVVNVLSSAPVEYKNALVEAAKAWCQSMLPFRDGHVFMTRFVIALFMCAHLIYISHERILQLR